MSRVKALAKGGWRRGSRSEKKKLQHFLNEMTVLAVLKLAGSGFQVKEAATAKALYPHFVRKRGTVSIFVLEDLSSLEFLTGTR